jgi:hypothetical protein
MPPKAIAQVQPKSRKLSGSSIKLSVRPSVSKQAHVIEMLRRPAGASIPAIMKATGWQPHSVRGFLAGCVRRKLGLPLTSRKTDGERLYRIVTGRAAKFANAKRSAV